MAPELTPEFQSEASKDQNRPIELYDIYLGSQTVCDEETYHYCTTNRKVNFFNLDGSPQSYAPFRITRDSIPASNQLEVEIFGGEFDNTDRLWSNWLNSKDIRGKRVVVRKVLLDLLTDMTHSKILFDGEVNAVSEISEKSAKIQTRSKLKSLSIKPGALQQLYCNNIFADEWCAFNVAATRLTGQIIDSGSSSEIVVDANRVEVDGYWNDGLIIFTSGSNLGQKRKVIDFYLSGHSIALDYALPNIPAAGDTYTIERGCDKSLSICTSRFANQANFFGFPDIPHLINPTKG